jgi:adenosylmethionine-8-amino-7-oxononanoate aminotransferase
MPEAVGGDGPYIIAADGRRYLDASSGAGVSCLGHSDDAVRRAIKQQLDRLPYAHTRYYTTAPMEALAEMLVSGAPAGIGKAWFTCGGSEGIEAALKLARQYFFELGEEKRRYFIGRRHGYQGNTIGALSIGGNAQRRALYEPILLQNIRHIAPCFPYRYKAQGESDEAYGRRVADELETAIQELGEDSVCAFVCETVVGSTAGAVSPVPGYFRRIREICDRYRVLLILDEVMCGLGRTGTRFACEQESIAPDMVVVGKGLAGGYVPLAALLVSETIHAAIRSGSGFFQHGHTFMGHATACAAALAVQQEIGERDLITNVRRQGNALQQALTDRLGNHPHVGDIRGRGLLLAIELVADHASKEPFDPKLRVHARIKQQGMQKGIMLYPMAGTADGLRGDHVMLMPPFIIQQEHVDEIVGFIFFGRPKKTNQKKTALTLRPHTSRLPSLAVWLRRFAEGTSLCLPRTRRSLLRRFALALRLHGSLGLSKGAENQGLTTKDLQATNNGAQLCERRQKLQRPLLSPAGVPDWMWFSLPIDLQVSIPCA